MAFDEGLAERLRDLTADLHAISERKMFGGLCFMQSGNMCFGIVGSELMVRVGPDVYEAALALPDARGVRGRRGRRSVGMARAGPRVRGIAPAEMTDPAEVVEKMRWGCS